jgi:hypothetical protein
MCGVHSSFPPKGCAPRSASPWSPSWSDNQGAQLASTGRLSRENQDRRQRARELTSQAIHEDLVIDTVSQTVGLAPTP